MSNLKFMKTTLSEFRFDDLAVLITPLLVWGCLVPKRQHAGNEY